MVTICLCHAVSEIWRYKELCGYSQQKIRYHQWRSQDLDVGAQGVWGTGSPPAGSKGHSPWWVVRRGIASRKLIAVIKDIWLPNHAQFLSI